MHAMDGIFCMKQANIGPVHVSIVRNEPLARMKLDRIGGFVTWDHGYLAGTIRIGSFFFNLDYQKR